MLAIIGVLAKLMQQQAILHPYSLSLNGTVYYHDNSPIQQGDFLYFDQYSVSKPGSNSQPYSTDDIDGDGDYDNWNISSTGQITFSTRIYYTQSISFPNAGTYYYNGSLQQGTVLYENQYSGASVAANLGPFGGIDIDEDGKNDLIVTNSLGALSWSTQILYSNSIILNGETYYYSNTLQSNVTYIYNGQYSDAAAAANMNGSGTEDIDGDGAFDDWYTNYAGVITFTPTIYKGSHVTLGGVNYYYDTGSFNNPMTVWNSPYSNAVLASNNSGIDDVDNDGNNDEWTIVDGTLSWSTQIIHPYQTELFANVIYGIANQNTISCYVDNSLPLAQGAILYNTQYSSAGVFLNSSGNQNDIDGDGNLDDWYTDSYGALYWNMRIMYENSLLSYYYTGSLTSGATILYTSQGSGASVASNLNESTWYTDNSGMYFEI